jgi:GH15 family glucan-1,4-alpha-glucosidase
VSRYDTSSGKDGFDSPEGAFLLCSFWYIDALAMTGRTDEAREKFERVLALANDVGLLSEEVDPGSGRLLGNFPQAFSHLGLVGSASNLTGSRIRPAEHRRGGTTPSQ